MIDQNKIPKREGYYWARVLIGHEDETDVQPVELVLATSGPRVYILGCESNGLAVVTEFVAPLDAPKESK